MKQFNLTKFETLPDGSVVLYSRDGRQMLIKRLEAGTRVTTAPAPLAGCNYPLGSDASLIVESLIHRAKISDIPFGRSINNRLTADDGVREILA